MVNTGRPSKGCFECRKRRVKCDEGKPHCQRCLNLKRKCPGYQDIWNAVVRSQNDWAKTSVSRRVEYKLKERELDDLTRQLPQSTDGSWLMEKYVPRIPPQFYVGPEVYAINRFYADYVLTAGTLPFLNYVPQMYNDPRSDPCFMEAVPAVALASSARQLNRHDLMEHAQYRYGQALKKLALVLRDENRARRDAALVTVFLLGLYEFITADSLPEKEWDSHGAGRIALLKLRGKKQLRDPHGRGLFILLHHQMMCNSFLSGKLPVSDFVDWIEGDNPKDPTLLLEGILYSASKLCHQMKAAISGNTETSNEELAQMVRQAIKLDGEVQEWKSALPSDWPISDHMMRVVNAQEQQYGLHLTCAGNEPNVPKGDMPQYTGITRAISRAQYRAVRINLLDVACKAAALLRDCPELQDPALLESWSASSVELAVAICDEVPFAMGEADEKGNPVYPTVSGVAIRGFSLLWPLHVAASVPGIGDERRHWVSEKLKYMGQALGIGRANAMARALYGVASP